MLYNTVTLESMPYMYLCIKEYNVFTIRVTAFW